MTNDEKRAPDGLAPIQASGPTTPPPGLPPPASPPAGQMPGPTPPSRGPSRTLVAALVGILAAALIAAVVILAISGGDDLAAPQPKTGPKVAVVGDTISPADGIEVELEAVLPATGDARAGNRLPNTPPFVASARVKACVIKPLAAGLALNLSPDRFGTELPHHGMADFEDAFDFEFDFDQTSDREPSYPESVTFSESTPVDTCQEGWIQLPLEAEPFAPTADYVADHYNILITLSSGDFIGWRVTPGALSPSDSGLPKAFEMPGTDTVGATQDQSDGFPVTLVSIETPATGTYRATVKICDLYREEWRNDTAFGPMVARAADSPDVNRGPGTVLAEGVESKNFKAVSGGDNCSVGAFDFAIATELPDGGFWLTAGEDNSGWGRGLEFWVPVS
ncbi:hypothetical protein [Nocardioides nitrophenolicus]|uniref:hypothetical protein n=1 Tax=Nocardioides nitrophenolicus TaxID=60489 RepID=UPI00195B3351|nr:hypothetical protein [Nocardioides nitrophenolicus]MBM7519210.1 hypothetical protein [Nocardioides nitrophenolicus]